jgi:hypothetical protein
LSPIQRTVTNYSSLAKAPCGGTKRGGVHFVGTPNSRNFIGWKIVHPSLTGNCTVRLGTGPDEDEYKVL